MKNTPFTDQTGFGIEVSLLARRIVSLVPSQTELLFALGAGEQVVGVTKFCIHPKQARREKKVVGGTKTFHLERVLALEPDLVLGNKEENEKTAIEQLRERIPVWLSDINNLESALEMIGQVGQLTGREAAAEQMVSAIADSFSRLQSLRPCRTLYLIWREPWMAVGPNTFIHDMLRRCGLANVVEQERYPALSMAQIEALAPEVVLLSSEPYPFKEAHRAELQKALPRARVLFADGEAFSWYGSRLLSAPAVFEQLMKEV